MKNWQKLESSESGGQDEQIDVRLGIFRIIKNVFSELLGATIIFLGVGAFAALLKIVVSYYEKTSWSDWWLVVGLRAAAYVIFTLDLILLIAIVAALTYRTILEVWR